MTVSAEARNLLVARPAIDLHADSLLWARWIGYRLGVRHRPLLPRAAYLGHVDVPRLVEGGFGAQAFGLVSAPPVETEPARQVDEQIDLLDDLASRPANRIEKVVSADQIEKLAGTGRVGALLGIEGAHALEGDLDAVARYAARGVRYLGLVHLTANRAGHPARPGARPDGPGLTAWGRELVERCEAAGVIVDLAHLNRRGFLEACRAAARPPIVSHTGASAVFAHWRGIDDAQVRAVGEKGGVVGIIFAARYLGGNGVDAVARHLLHVIDVAGEDAAALGSDWDGMIVPVRDLSEACALPVLVDALLARRLSERVIGKILRDNVMRVLRATAPR
jgi:membrane dipeptidase